MPVRNILIPMCPDIAADAQLEAALPLARHLNGHINAVYVHPDTMSGLSSLPTRDAARISIGEREREAEAAVQAKAKEAFELWRARHRLPSGPLHAELQSTYACWSEQDGRLEISMMRLGRLSDLIVINYPASWGSASDRIFDVTAFETGRPVVLVPKTVPDDLLRHVLIAWNGSLEATRAVAGALPLLHEAETVSVFTAPWRNDDYAESDTLGEPHSLTGYLDWHGIRACTLRAGPDSSSVGAGLLRAAGDHGATLVVMGAYTRSRIRRTMLGGVTDHILRAAAMPVLLVG